MKKTISRFLRCILIALFGFVSIPSQSILGQLKNETIAFKNVNLITLTSDKVFPSQTVIVKGDRIVEIGSTSEITIPQEAKVIDGTGKYLMPGIADMHCHPSEFFEPVHPLDLFLANGVTTIRCLQPDNGGIYILRWRDEVNSGKRIGPKIYSSGLTYYDNFGRDTSKYHITEQQKAGFDLVKLYSSLGKETFNNLMSIAKERKLYTVGHIPFNVGLDGVLAAKMDEIAHIEEIIFNELFPIDRNKVQIDLFKWYMDWGLEIIKRYKTPAGINMKELMKQSDEALNIMVSKLQATKTPVHSTLFLDERIIEKLFSPEGFKKSEDWNYFNENYRNAFLQGKEKHQKQFKGFEEGIYVKFALDSALCNKLHKAGVPLIFGTDAAGGLGLVPGLSVHQEFATLVKCGLTPYEALLTATVNASNAVAAMNGINDFGTIEIGKRADLILLDKNPLTDIANLKSLTGTMASGNWLAKETLEDKIKIDDKQIPKSGREVLMSTITEKGLDAAVAQYWKAKNAVSKEDRLIVSQGMINAFGYDLIKKNMIKEAIDFFKFNTLEYPISFNVFDSLGEAYKIAGNKTLAIENYKKVLKLNPYSENAKKMLKELGH